MRIKVGDRIPEFETTDANGAVFSINTLLGKKPLVIYFYPKDDTPGCTKEACAFRDSYEDFSDLGAEIIGISGDSSTSHQKFASRYKLPFILLADKGNVIRKQFGVPTNLLGLLPGRVTYIVDRAGIVRLVFNSMNASQHMPKALEAIRSME
ncbi:peroxiredoxin [Flavobacterium sp. WV_118_3]|jgi:peroxiredoxin Q/BCP|uniref:peroxiredoxin n=1 Tax=Flavobacterium sp. WV_118_3 TaxID=3151764 RepID=UPI0012C1A706|nr:peroxiredoxin [Flavobacterium sp.]HRB71413.1 peroxiredoxin [Flavobacterium sp.]